MRYYIYENYLKNTAERENYFDRIELKTHFPLFQKGSVTGETSGKLVGQGNKERILLTYNRFDRFFHRGIDPNIDIYCKTNGIENILKKLLNDLFFHELYHIRFCPGNYSTAQKLMRAVKKGLERGGNYGFKNCLYTANLIEDIFVDYYINKILQKNCRAGSVLFLYDQGCKNAKNSSLYILLELLEFGKDLIKYGRHSPLPWGTAYEIFVKCELELFGEEADRAFLSPCYQKNQEKLIDDKVNEILSILEWGRLIQDRSKWEYAFEEISFILSEYINIADLPPINSCYLNSPNNAEDMEKLSRDNHKINFIDCETGKAVKCEDIYKSLSLDSHYRGLAHNLNYKIYKNRDYMKKNIDYSVKVIPFNLIEDFKKIKPEKHIFKKVAIFLDRSISMALEKEDCSSTAESVIPWHLIKDRIPHNILKRFSEEINPSPGPLPWTSKSRFHYALLFLYGLRKWAIKTGRIEELNITFFGKNYETTGWFRLDKWTTKAKKFFSELETGTELKVDTIKNTVGDKKGVLVFIVTDGELSGQEEIMNYFLENVSSVHAAVISILSENSVFRKSKKITVINIEKLEELVNLGINIAGERLEKGDAL